MCGVAGFFGNFDRRWLASAVAILSHRGPDDEGFWYSDDGRIGLGHRRLSIIDLSPLGHQPMVHGPTGCVVSFNGEIYNFRELRDELSGRGCRFKSASDTEVLLMGLVEFGLDFAKRLNGIFAFAFWDPRTQSLLLVRDQFGVKPMYVSETPEGWVFASELKALLLEPSVSRQLDHGAFAGYLTYLWGPGERTPFQSIRKLQPGCALQITPRGVLSLRYFQNAFSEDRSNRSDRQIAAELDEVLGRSVARQLVADVPVGAFLSGGLDSSAVVARAVRICGAERMQCFTIAPPAAELSREGMAADLPYAKAVAEHLGVDLHVIDLQPNFIDRLPEVIYHLDEPQADPATINVLLISELAREHGIKVLLSGTAGDDVFSGYRRHAALCAERLWGWLPSGARKAMQVASRRLPRRAASLRRFAKVFEYAGLGDSERLLAYFFWHDPDRIATLFNGAIGPSRAGIVAPMVDALSRYRPPLTGLNRMLAIEQEFFLPDHNLNYTDKLSMAASVEVRVPLLDLDLVRFANALPQRVKQKGLEGKWIFKKAMEPYLPRNVIYRPKAGFGAPLRQWLRGPLSPWVDEYLSQGSVSRRGIFNPAAVAALIDDDRRGRLDASYTIFALISAEIWCRTFVDQVRPTPITT